MSQLNVFLFEIGMVTSDPLLGTEVATTIGVHPLVVRPSSIRYNDASRSPVGQTVGGAVLTRSGRALRPLSLSGVFGVEDRGLGPYLGTGETRFQRFYKEVVRLPEAMNRDDVEACIDPFNGTPLLRELLATYNPDMSTFYVNWYDFWHGVSFECNIEAFTPEWQHRNAGATGMTSYSLQAMEVGPVKVASFGQRVIEELFAGFTIWDGINDVVSSYSIDGIESSFVSLTDTVAGPLKTAVASMSASIDQVTSLMGASTASSAQVSSTAGAAFLRNASDTARLATAAAAEIEAESSGAPNSSSGTTDWAAVVAEGDNAELYRFEQLVALLEVADAAAWQPCAGLLFGMSVADYVAYITSGGVGSTVAPELRGSTSHIVSDTDTPDTLEALFGVAWALILAANGLTPDEALLSGTSLAMPRPRAKGPQTIAGLPTFGSHIGRAAWGVDLDVRMICDDNGRPVLVSGDAILEQAITVLYEGNSGDIMRAAEQTPDSVQSRYLSQRISRLVQSDERIAAVQAVDVVVDPSAAGFDVSVTAIAINGGTIRTGGPST
jgi:hypothetical protein